MKVALKICSSLTLLLCVAACSQSSTVIVTESKCDLQVYATDIDKLLTEWDDTNAIASRTPRISLASPIAQLQKVRRSTEEITAPECAKRVHYWLVNAMDITIQAYLDFLSERDTSSQELIKEAEISFRVFAHGYAALKAGERNWNEQAALEMAQPTVTPFVPTTTPLPPPTSTPQPKDCLVDGETMLQVTQGILTEYRKEVTGLDKTSAAYILASKRIAELREKANRITVPECALVAKRSLLDYLDKAIATANVIADMRKARETGPGTVSEDLLNRADSAGDALERALEQLYKVLGDEL